MAFVPQRTFFNINRSVVNRNHPESPKKNHRGHRERREKDRRTPAADPFLLLIPPPFPPWFPSLPRVPLSIPPRTRGTPSPLPLCVLCALCGEQRTTRNLRKKHHRGRREHREKDRRRPAADPIPLLAPPPCLRGFPPFPESRSPSPHAPEEHQAPSPSVSPVPSVVNNEPPGISEETPQRTQRAQRERQEETGRRPPPPPHPSSLPSVVSLPPRRDESHGRR